MKVRNNIFLRNEREREQLSHAVFDKGGKRFLYLQWLPNFFCSFVFFFILKLSGLKKLKKLNVKNKFVCRIELNFLVIFP